MADHQPVLNEQHTGTPDALPEDVAKAIRKLSHDLSNAYLLGTVELKEPATEWLRMLEDGVARALDLNNALRTTIRQRS